MALSDEEWAAELRRSMAWSHKQHTATCMSDTAEKHRGFMTAGAVEMNHRLHMEHVAAGLEAAAADGVEQSKAR
ncbi:hypothetical protein [Actinoplanes sp. NPDC026670]|uniref:hypothetical protein n=1 Tax=Actinoplanes sp. NPDC026670 TaxID=3154700 RepID=UPI0033F82304